MDDHDFDAEFESIVSSEELADLQDVELPTIMLQVDLTTAFAAVEARTHVEDHMCPPASVWIATLMDAFIDEMEARLEEYRNGSDFDSE